MGIVVISPYLRLINNLTFFNLTVISKNLLSLYKIFFLFYNSSYCFLNKIIWLWFFTLITTHKLIQVNYGIMFIVIIYIYIYVYILYYIILLYG